MLESFRQCCNIFFDNVEVLFDNEVLKMTSVKGEEADQLVSGTTVHTDFELNNMHVTHNGPEWKITNTFLTDEMSVFQTIFCQILI